MNFAVFECTNTLELCEAATAAEFTAWVPVRISRRLVIIKKGQPPIIRDSRQAAMPGYIFVARDQQQSFWRWGSLRYNIKMMTEYRGPSNMPGHRRAQFFQPVQVELQELTRMNELLEQEWAEEQARWLPPPPVAEIPEPAPEPIIPLARGDKVKVVVGIFKGLEGTIVKAKDLDIRVEFAGRYVTMPGIWVKRKDSACK